MLSPEQIEKRKGKLTASRMKVLMDQVPEELNQLYLEFIGEALPEDLSDDWNVQLGSATEDLNIFWYAKKNKNAVSRQKEVVTHPHLPWAACTLDGWDDVLKCPIECKHVGGREPLEVIIDRYQPQMQWQMEVMQSKQCALSVIMGANEPRVEYIERSDDYIAEMIRRGKRFMVCVAARLPPVVLPPQPAPVPLDKMREEDMSANEVWKTNAQIWIQTYAAAKSASDAEKVLKKFVADDVRKAFGHGVRITRDKAGRLSLREDKS